MRRRFSLAAAAAFLAVVVLLPLASAATSTGGSKAAPAAAAKAKAPAAPPAPPNITALMSKGGCRAFASLVEKSPDALSAFQSAAEGGVTAFCPTDDAVRAFAPRYRNLTADGKASLLLFHAVPVYYTLRGLKSSNGPMNTLATDGAAQNYNFTVQNVGDQVTVRTEASGAAAARVRDTVYDKDPVAIYAVDAVLEPVELFEPVADAPAPAPAPAAVADAPRASKKPSRHRPRHVADAPGPAADDDAATADQRKNAKKNAAPGAPWPRWLAAVSVALAAALV